VNGRRRRKMNKIQVLDKGFVRLVDHHGDDLMVVNAARVSFAKESQWTFEKEGNTGGFREVLSDRDTKLINYLAKHEHWTPFGHPQITLHFKWPIFVGRQAMRSNIGICWNEVSRRYVDDPPEFYCPAEWRKRPEGGIKQGSGESVVDAMANTVYDDLMLECEDVYNTMLEKGYAPEMARAVLPQSTYTECWGTFSLAALARFYSLRSDSHAQKEIQDYANAISQLVEPLFPCAWSELTGGDK
jgi:thymidylate synthase (FAD)